MQLQLLLEAEVMMIITNVSSSVQRVTKFVFFTDRFAIITLI